MQETFVKHLKISVAILATCLSMNENDPSLEGVRGLIKQADPEIKAWSSATFLTVWDCIVAHISADRDMYDSN